MTHQDPPVDEAVRAAVLDLFRANHQLQRAYAAYARSGDATLFVDASLRVDDARERVLDAQARVDER